MTLVFFFPLVFSLYVRIFTTWEQNEKVTTMQVKPLIRREIHLAIIPFTQYLKKK